MRHTWAAVAATLFVLALPSCGDSASSPGRSTATTATSSDALAGVHGTEGRTAIAIRQIGAPTFPWPGTDGKYHVDYDLVLTNATTLPAAVDRIEVVDAGQPAKVVATFSGKELVDPACEYGECNRLRALPSAPAKNTVLAPSESRVMLVDFTVDALADAPKAVLHHLYLQAPVPPVPKPVAVDYLAGPVDTSAGTPRVIGPPVKGPNWVALNGCCAPNSWHRSAILPADGGLSNSQRFAIDWKQANAQGAFVSGDKTKNASYVDYGSNIYAVADGTVVSTLDDQRTNTPGTLPATDPKLAAKLTFENADGNHIILDIGGGVYAMYAHMIPGSLAVKAGDTVNKGDVIGKLGNTGNASASHMHFQLMNNPSILAGDGVPYVIDRFTYRGQVPVKTLLGADAFFSGRVLPPGLPAGEPRAKQLPLALAVVDFPAD